MPDPVTTIEQADARLKYLNSRISNLNNRLMIQEKIAQEGIGEVVQHILRYLISEAKEILDKDYKRDF